MHVIDSKRIIYMERGFYMENEKQKVSDKKKMKRVLIAAVIFTAALITIGVVFSGGEEKVAFEKVNEKSMPPDLTTDVIPEYKTLERALACVVDNNVYVLVTRGEKPTSGYSVSVDRIVLEETEGKENLIVYALFEDPDKKTPISQIITYPLCVVETDLDRLPDSIELRIQY